MRRFNNSFQVQGYLKAKPTSRTLPSGTLVANGHLAESPVYTNAVDSRDQPPNWFPLSFYDAMARKALGCDKGDHLLIIKSRIEQRKFTLEDGHKRLVWEVIVDEFHVLERKAGEHVAAAAPRAHPDVLPADDWPVGVDL
jgi:single-stranded DNA-binding protein